MPETEIRAPALGQAGEQCAHCGAELARDQRYCVNCGLRRAEPRVDYRQLLAGGGEASAATVVEEIAASAPQSQPPPAANDTRTVSPLGAAVAIGLLLLAVLLGAVIGRGGDSASPAPVVVGAAPAAVEAAFTGDWTGDDGWTVQLVSLPKASTQPAQVAAAKTDAQAKGAAEVGALDSDTFVSLPSGTYVIYSGHYDSPGAARTALKRVKTSFPQATVIEVSTTASGTAGGATDGTAGTSRKSSSGGSSSGDKAVPKSAPDPTTQNYVKKSKKLPDKVGTGGAPPATDNKAPGGGSDGTTIG